MRRGLILTVLLVAVGAARADDEFQTPSLEGLLSLWCRADSDDVRAQVAWTLLQEDPTGERTALALPKVQRWSPEREVGEVLEWKQEVPERGEHTIFGYVPTSYTADRSWPLLVWLHGGVARDGDGGGRSGLGTWAAIAQDDDFLVLCPSARTGSEWWTPAGTTLVLEAVQQMCRQYRVDANRILLAGFSDGASACWHFLANFPGPFCGMASLMGHPLVPRVAGGPAFAANLSSRPVFAVNGGRDRLYPSAGLAGLMEQVRAEGCDLEWTDMPEAGHDISEVRALWPRLRQWWIEHPRNPVPTEVRWQCVRDSAARGRDWIEITEVDREAPGAHGAETGVMPSPRTEAQVGYGRPTGWVWARVHPDGEVEIETQGLVRFTLHLCEEWAGAQHPLRIRLNGKALDPPRTHASAAYVLERQDGCGDGEPLWKAALWLDP